MYPRVSSYAAICGRSPVASVGQKATAAAPPREAKARAAEPLDETPDDGAQPAEAPLKDSGDAIDAIE